MKKLGTIIYGNNKEQKSFEAVSRAALIDGEAYFVDENKVFTHTMLAGCTCEPAVIIIDQITTVENMNRAFSMASTGKLWVEPILNGGTYIEPYFIFVMSEEISNMAMLVCGFGKNITHRFNLLKCNKS